MIALQSSVRPRLLAVLLAIGLCLSPSMTASAGAQERGLSRVGRYAGKPVWVIDRAGRTLLVRVVSATDLELAVTVGGSPQTIPAADIVRVFVDGDSVKNGAIIGALIGLPAGVLGCQGSVSSDCDAAGYAIVGAVTYGAIGAFFDWLHHGRTVLYRAPGP
jgi:hypothetical protein